MFLSAFGSWLRAARGHLLFVWRSRGAAEDSIRRRSGPILHISAVLSTSVPPQRSLECSPESAACSAFRATPSARGGEQTETSAPMSAGPTFPDIVYAIDPLGSSLFRVGESLLIEIDAAAQKARIASKSQQVHSRFDPAPDILGPADGNRIDEIELAASLDDLQ